MKEPRPLWHVRQGRLVTLLLALSTMGLTASAANATTYVARRGSSAAKIEWKAALSSIGPEIFCNDEYCVVTASEEGEIALGILEKDRVVTLEELPAARKLFFQQATFDVNRGAFDRAFSGDRELGSSDTFGQYVLVFKTYPQAEWLTELETAGVVPLHPIRTMGFLVFGPRASIKALTESMKAVLAVVEVPAGLKRLRFDRWDSGADARLPVLVEIVTAKRDFMLDVLLSVHGRSTPLAYRTGATEAYRALLTLPDAMALSSFPEVVSLSVAGLHGGPSDERSNRIVAGDWQAPGSSWTSVLDPNSSSPRYWDGFLSNLASAGLDLSNQTIGFIDSGIDGGLQQNGSAFCPPYLRPPGYPTTPCRLVMATDVSTNFADLDRRGDDFLYHGTLTSAIAAGFASSASPGRDAQQYAFSQGLAQNVKVASCQFFAGCGAALRGVGEADPAFSPENDHQRLRYALLELTASGTLPDGVPGGGAHIINNSWNLDTIDYEELAILLDQTSRSLSSTWFNFGGPLSVVGARRPVLHVISAGNFPQYYPDSDVVTAPGAAKNGLTVGATETYNQQSYLPDPCPNNAAEFANNPRQVFLNTATGASSRAGYPNLRFKPDIVAPGIRAYGRRSTSYSGCAAPCNSDLDGSLSYVWSNGTSFAAPVVSGAAAITREWLRTLGFSSASPALVKATLIGSARNLAPCAVGCPTCTACFYCNQTRPAPDRHQGWGGLSLDRLFQASSNYHFFDQGHVFTANGQTWSRTLTLSDRSRDTVITLVWTDRASGGTVSTEENLVNDLDLRVTYNDGLTHAYYGNNYFTSPDSCQRDGYSLRDPSPVYDRVNNVERITIRASDIPSSVSTVTVTVSAFAITGNGTQPMWTTPLQQDFALMAINAR